MVDAHIMTSTAQRSTPTRIVDPKAVAAITHPLRMRLLAELSRCGAARAVDLAAMVGEPANSVSFHLRQLARFALIEEDPTRARNARERWWRQTSDRGFEFDLEAMRQLDGGEAAVATLDRVAEGHVLALHRAIHQSPIDDDARPATDATQGAGGRFISDDFALRLSPDELDRLRTELAEFFDRWGEISRTHPPSGGDVERRPYYGLVMAAPEADISAIYRHQPDQHSTP